MRNLFIAAFVAAASLAITSCGSGSNNSEEHSPVMEFRSFDYDVIAQLADADSTGVDGSAYCRVSGQGILPEKIGNLDLALLQDTLTKIAGVIMVDKNLAQPALDNDLAITKKDVSSTEACSVMVNELSVDLITPQLVVWKDYSYSYPCGAAHGMYSTTYVNFEVEKGRIITLEDLFGKDYETKLEGLIRQKLEEEKVTLLVEPDEIKVPSDFRITTNSVEFIYSLYEIAPYSEGEIKVDLSRFEIEDLFMPGVEEMIFGNNFD